ncbi:hypothetical protein M432DRAFT_135106 [Thermoascus aurantiacus ATCC 26904]
MLKALSTLATKLQLVYIVLDALDESNRDPTMKVIRELVTLGPSKLNILLTSRREHDIEAELETIPAVDTVDIQFQASGVDSDIKKFVADKLQHHKFKYLEEDLRKRVEQKLTEGPKE